VRISCGIGGAHRGDARARLQAGLEEADAAVILDPVDGQGLRRQAELPKMRRELALKGEVVDRHHVFTGGPS
jgi:hypothetical protein